MLSNSFFGRYGALPILFLMAFLTLSPALAHNGHDDMPENMPGMEMSWPTASDSGMMMSHKERPKTFEGRVIAWLGAWHPAVIHFPIALTLTVAFLELAAAIRRNPAYSASNKILLALAVIGAFVAAPLGWADAGLPTIHDNSTLIAHRWIGTAIPFLLAFLWYLKRPTTNSRSFQISLAALVVIILVQAYLGGEITHGAHHMAF